MKYFPIYLELKNRNVLVVGQGSETAQKITQLLTAGVNVILISEKIEPYFDNFLENRNFKFKQKRFDESDLEGVWLVVSTLEDRRINEFIFKSSSERNIFCNVVDVTDLCSFIFPAIVSQGDILVAISTSGSSPALAQHLKEKISGLVGPEYGALSELLGDIRKNIINRIPDKKRRSALFHNLINPKIIGLLKKNKKQEALGLAEKMVDEETKKENDN